MTNYDLIIEQLKGLFTAEPHPLPGMANLSALLMDSMEDISWAGFYLMNNGSLMLGPFQGKLACIRIQTGKGVCGKAVEEDRTQLVPDVHKFPGHIACDCATNSELVIPIHFKGQVIGVLDLDSKSHARFTKEDQQGLEQVVALMEEICDWGCSNKE